MPSLTDSLRTEIESQGPISFARFMAQALYRPELGYYERAAGRIGRGGDFYTSVSVGSVFGELLARRFAAWLGQIPGERLLILEAGAHDGRLAADILSALRKLAPDPARRIGYGLLEPSPQRREWQAQTLREFADRVTWYASLNELPPSSVAGVIFGNEFLDALPVHRLGWDAPARRWFEWRVGWVGQRFCWVRPPRSATGDTLAAPLAEALQTEFGDWLRPALLAALPDGYTLEVRPAATAWWRQAAKVLRAGWLVAIDYGFTTAEALRPERTQGTARAYARHRYADDLLAAPGEQDLTAHVNFTPLIAAGEAAGLTTEGLSSQASFLVATAEAAGEVETFGRWKPAQRRQFQTLVHPAHLGERFKVLVQSRPAR